jgi:hypothetical protein
MFILNEDNLECNRQDPQCKGGNTVPTIVQEINIASPLLITGGIKYITNESWKEILPHYYFGTFCELQEKEIGQGFSADYNSGTQTTKYY